MRSNDFWEAYINWNNAIADTIFKPEFAGRNVFLDFEESELLEIRDKINFEGEIDQLQDELGNVLYAVLKLDQGPAAVFEKIFYELGQWQMDISLQTPPPTICLLSVLSMVAEGMRSDEELAANNYYDRLGEFVKTGNPKELDNLRKAYGRKVKGVPISRRLWTSLHDWLTIRLEGSRGLPTASPMTLSHIGWPISQALVRETDRRSLSDFYSKENFSPNFPPDDLTLESKFDKWVRRTPSPVSNALFKLWDQNKGGTRDRILDVLREGIPPRIEVGTQDEEISSGNTTRLLAFLQKKKFKPIDLTLEFGLEESESIGFSIAIRGLDEEWVPIPFERFSDGMLVSSLNQEETEPLFWSKSLESLVKFQIRHNDIDVREIQRIPKKVVPFRRDPSTNTFFEVDRVELNKEMIVLVNKSIEDFVDNILKISAQPGYLKHLNEENHTIPQGWVLFEQVRIVDVIDSEEYEKSLENVQKKKAKNHLLPMFALPSFDVSMSQGFKLPGYLRGLWHSSNPPQVAVSTDSGASLLGELRKSDPTTGLEEPIEEKKVNEPRLVWNLSQLALTPGNYSLEVKAGKKVTSRSFTLCSADLESARPYESISYLPQLDPFCSLSAKPFNHDDAFQVSPLIQPSKDSDLPRKQVPLPDWQKNSYNSRSQQGRQVLKIMTQSFDCLEEAHTWKLPSSEEEKEMWVKYYEIKCRVCGATKMQKHRRQTQKEAKAKIEENIESISFDRSGPVRDLPPLEDRSEIPTFFDAQILTCKEAYDALCYVRSGSKAWFEQIADHVNSTDEYPRLFSDRFLRNLEATGHLSVKRDDRMNVLQWIVNDPAVVETNSGRWVMTGFRSEKLLATLQKKIDYEEIYVDDCAPIIQFNSFPKEEIFELAQYMEDSGHPLKVIPDASLRLLSVIPKLSKVRDAIPQFQLITGVGTEFWDHTYAQWDECEDLSVHKAGAYKLKRPGTVYMYRSPRDCEDGKIRITDARVGKYLAALDEKASLIGYEYQGDNRTLYVPLGADLPGLFGRVATLESGYPPEKTEHLLRYREVRTEIAEKLNYLLTN